MSAKPNSAGPKPRVLIIANALHRRMTEGEMKRMVGQKIFDGLPRRNS